MLLLEKKLSVVLHRPGWISSWVDFDSNTTQKDSQDGQCPTAQRSEIQRAGLMY